MAAVTPPTVADLSALMRARTQGELSYQGVFNSDTLPTDVQAQAMIDLALTLVVAKIGSDVSDSLASAATSAVRFKAAALVEVTYYPEQANDDNSAYALYQAQYEELRDALVSALNDDQPNHVRFGSVPTYGRKGYDPANPPTTAALPPDPTSYY